MALDRYVQEVALCSHCIVLEAECWLYVCCDRLHTLFKTMEFLYIVVFFVVQVI